MDCIKCKRQIPGDSVFCMYCGKDQRDTAKRTRRGNNTGTVYKRPDGKWQVTVTVGWFMKDGVKHRRTKSATFTKRTDAVNAAPGLIGAPPSSKETVREIWDLYQASKDFASVSDSQRYKLRLAYKRWEPLELRPIAALTVDDLQTCIDRTTDNFYPARDMKVIMSHLYKIAVRREIVPRNKAEDIELPDAPTAKRLCEMNRDYWYETYHEALARMGLPDYPPQTCRHWYFTTLTAAGIQPGIIAETGGHSSYLTTMKNYVRIPLSAKLAAADSLGKPDRSEK